MISSDLNADLGESFGRYTLGMDEKIMEVIPPYLAPLGEFRFERGQYPNKEWPVKASVYRYHLDPADIAKESAVVAAFAYLVN